MEDKRILDLITKEQLQIISPEEQLELEIWLASSPQNRKRYEDYINEPIPPEFGVDAGWVRFSLDFHFKPSLN